METNQRFSDPGDLTPNHVHADYMDVLAALRIADRHITEGLIESKVLIDLATVDNLRVSDEENTSWWPDERVWEQIGMLLSFLEDGGVDLKGPAVTGNCALALDHLGVAVVAACLHEAIVVAHREGFANVAKRTQKIVDELTSGRKGLTLVLGLCSACWPKV